MWEKLFYSNLYNRAADLDANVIPSTLGGEVALIRCEDLEKNKRAAHTKSGKVGN